MPGYRCSLLDRAKEVRAVERLDCEHDAAAIILAINILVEQTCYHYAEVWCGSRIVALLPKTDLDFTLPLTKPEGVKNNRKSG